MNFINGAGLLFSFLLTIITILRYRERINLLLFSWFIWTSLLFEIILYVMADNGINNWWVIDIFYVLEILFITKFLAPLLKLDKRPKRLYLIWLILFSIFVILKFVGGNYQFHWTLFSIIIFSLSGFCLGVFCLNHEGGQLTRQPLFWILAGMVLYYGVTTLTFNPFVIMKNGSTLERFLPVVNQAMNVLAYIFYSIAYLCKKPAVLTS